MRIQIAPIEPKYAKDTWRLRNNYKIWQFAQEDAPMPATLESERNFYATMQTRTDNIMYAILDEKGLMIGAVTLKKVKYGTAGIGYYILDPSLQGGGIGKTAVNLLLNVAFNEKKLDIVYAWINPDNIASLKIALDLGFYSVGHSLIDPQLHRLEITKTIWKERNE